MNRDSINCPFPSCPFASKSAHGVDIHFSIKHAQKIGKRDRDKDDTENRNKHKCRRQRYELPITLGGKGARLEVDRRTCEAFGDDDMCGENEAPMDSRDNSTSQIHPLLCGDDSEPEVEEHGNAPTLEKETPSPECLFDLVTLLSRLHKCAGSGLVDKLLRLLSGHGEAIQGICNSVRSFSELMQYCKDRVSSALARDGFHVVKLRTTAGVSVEMYVRDAVSVIREQVASVRTDQLVTKPSMSDVSTHVMNSELGYIAAPLVQREVMTCADTGVSWRDLRRDGEQSFAGFLQLYSDKSQTSLKSSAFTLYPFHATLLNLTEEARRDQIVTGRSVVAYLPVSLDGCTSTAKAPFSLDSLNPDQYRALYTEVLHSAIDRALGPLREVCYTGMPCKDKNGFRYRLHAVIGSYCADIPEACLVLAVRFGNKTARPCHRCYVAREDMPLYSKCTKRSSADTMLAVKRKSTIMTPTIGFKPHLGERLFSTSETAVLKGLSLQAHSPILHDFPFMNLHPCLDIYQLFSFEPMHNLYLGVSKLLKDCACERLRSKEILTSSITTSLGESRSFFSVRSAVLREVNIFVRVALRSAFGNSLRMNVAGSDTKGFFGPNGVTGMLEARDMRCVDQISPFMGAIMDRLCGDHEEGPVTAVFVDYCDVVSTAYQRHSGKGWTIPMVGQLAKAIAKLKVKASKLFGRYQASGMIVPKWHLLDHICEDIMRYGNLSTLDGCLFEYSHGALKTDYRGGSRRRASALSETVARFGERLVLQSMRDEILGDRMSSLTVARIGTKPARALRGAIADGDGARVTRAETAVECYILHEFIRDLALARDQLIQNGSFPACHSFSVAELRVFITGACYPQPLFDMASVVGIDGFRVFVRLMDEMLDERGFSSRRSSNVRVRFPNSCYISGYPAPSLSHCRGSLGVVSMDDESRRFAQRIIAKASFHGSSVPRLDDIMLQGSPSHEVQSGHSFDVWFAKALQFVSIDIPNENPARSSEFTGSTDAVDVSSERRDFCFLQYYEVVTGTEVSVDAIDKKLSCIRLKWSRGDEEAKRGTTSKFYGLEPVDSIRGKVHIVPATSGLNLLRGHVSRVRELQALGTPTQGWTTDLFYVNRFVEEYGIAFDVGSGKR